MSDLFKFQKGIHAKVVVPKVGNTADLEIHYESDVLEFYLDGEKLFSGDWTNNFLEVFTIFLKELGKREA